MDSITFLQNLIDLKRKLAQKVELWAKGSKHPQCRDPTRANDNGYP
jgi:hypothetical protein